MFKFKHTLSTIVAFALSLSIGSALAAVDVNTANSDALRGIKGIGPAKAIFDERQAHGPFKDAADLGARVKGMGGKTVARLEAEGLTIGASAKTAGNPAGNPANASSTQVSTSYAQKPAVVKK